MFNGYFGFSTRQIFTTITHTKVDSRFRSVSLGDIDLRTFKKESSKPRWSTKALASRCNTGVESRDIIDCMQFDFAALSDSELVERYNGDVGGKGWTQSRGVFQMELRSEMERRFDLSAIRGKNSSNRGRRRIRLEGREIFFDD